MKKISVLAAALSLGICAGMLNVPVFAGTPEENASQLLKDVSGKYDELFTVICDPKYDQLWLDDCSAIVGEEAAEISAEVLKSACTGTIYGEEAVRAFGDGSEGMQFDCYFINDVDQFVFDGNHISGLDENGEELFGYDYTFTQELSLGGMMDGYLYETDAEDAGEFRYFLMMPDTPESTYHIEFRYGSDIDALSLYNEGVYAYWLAAGISADYDEQMVEDVIDLFVRENLEETGEETGAMTE